MKPIQSQLFSFFTSAAPELVWPAITRPELNKRYFHGVRLESSWRPGTIVTARTPGPVSIQGQVLAATPAKRLSFFLRSGQDQPATYITWEVRPVASGSVVRLYVDEAGGPFDAAEEAEDSWLPIVAGLQSVLAEPSAPALREWGVSALTTVGRPPDLSGRSYWWPRRRRSPG